MEATSQVILRNSDCLSPGPVLLVNPPRDTLFRQLQAAQKRVRISTQDFGDFRWLRDNGADASFEIVPEPGPDCRSAVLYLPREKQRLTMLLHAIASRLPPQAGLLLIGQNRAGIKSARRHLEQVFGNVQKRDSARHCVLFTATAPAVQEPFELDAYAKSWPIDCAGRSIDVVSLPGVFAHGRLDGGSALLLETLARLGPSGRVLDFAAGCGVIGASLLAANAAIDLTLLDVSAAALDSSRRTLAVNGLKAVTLASDGLSEVRQRYDWIVSNPPFHRGVDNHLETAARFFSEAGTFLADSGRIVIVCNRHLPYRKWMQREFHRVERLEQNREFMIVLAERPKKQ